MLPKKQKTRQEPLLEHFKLPKFLKGIGGDEIFRNMEVKSRKEIQLMQSIGHSISPGDIDLKIPNALGDSSLFWKSKYGNGWTSVDFFPRNPKVKIT